MKGNLFLIPTPLGDSPLEMVVPAGVESLVGRLDYFIVENVKTARRYIRKLVPDKPIDPIAFYTLNKHTPPGEIAGFITPLEQGHDMGLMSEAGVPGIADPGEEAVAEAQRKGIAVVPLTGPSSIILALMGSGLNAENFAFSGYLPIKRRDRIRKINALEKKSRHEGQTQIFMETPYRNGKLLADILSQCMDETWLCIASEITTEKEFIRTRYIHEWKKQVPDLHKKPTIFILSAVPKH